jgi:hypothetical protein
VQVQFGFFGPRDPSGILTDRLCPILPYPPPGVSTRTRVPDSVVSTWGWYPHMPDSVVSMLVSYAKHVCHVV